jgi:hypothetical protein
MNTKYLVVAAAMAAMLVAATALATDDAFATKKRHHSESQAVAQTNDCGNGDTPVDVFCQNLISQLEGDGNAVIILGAQP